MSSMILAPRELYRRITIGLGTSKFYLPKGQNLKKFVKLIQRLWEKLKKWDYLCGNIL